MIADTFSTLLAELAPLAEPALLHEAMGRRGALTHDIKPVFAGARVLGRAFTLRGTPGDNLVFHHAIACAKSGDVLVATVDGFLEAGGFGEIAAVAAQARGILGFVLDGAVRDVDAIARLGFPVFARGVSIKGTTKLHHGEMNVPINVGGIRIHPGDVIVGGTDGVLAIPAAELGAVIAKARQIKAREAEIMDRLRAGDLTVDLLGLQPILKQNGVNGESASAHSPTAADDRNQ